MNRNYPSVLFTFSLGLMCLTFSAFSGEEATVGAKIKLPPPQEKSAFSLEESLWKRHSVRAFTSQTPSWEQVGQLLWSGQGINRPGTNKRTAPSAGAVFPMTLYVILSDGFYKYLPEEHAVVTVVSGDQKKLLNDSGIGQNTVYSAPCVFMICAEWEKTSAKYQDQATRYIYLEAGHIAQNILLQAVGLKMGGVPIGAVMGEKTQKALNIPPEQKPVYLVAVGFPRENQQAVLQLFYGS